MLRLQPLGVRKTMCVSADAVAESGRRINRTDLKGLASPTESKEPPEPPTTRSSSRNPFQVCHRIGVPCNLPDSYDETQYT